MLTNIIVVVALVGLALVVFMFRSAGTISGTEARQLVSGGATLIDVRTPSEFSAHHIEGAVSIPVDRIAERLDQFGDKTDSIVVYCRSGSRSARAKRILEGEGFRNVSNLGALHRWPHGQ